MQPLRIGLVLSLGLIAAACAGADLQEGAAAKDAANDSTGAPNASQSPADDAAESGDGAAPDRTSAANEPPSGEGSDAAEPSNGTPLSGEELFRSPQPDGNTFTCSTCHSLTGSGDAFRRAGHPLDNVLLRPSFKNGALSEPLQAVNSCLSEWMGAGQWTDSSEEWALLEAYFEEQATESEAVEPLSFEIVPPPPLEALMAGVPSQGRTLFNETCASCHGEDATGTQKAPELRAGLSAELVARRVRTSGLQTSEVYDGLTGGRMPFWSKERLSDDELAHLVAFVQAIDSAEPSADDEPEPPDEPASPSDCGEDHPKVGQTGSLSNKAHGVSGTVTVIDNCTLEVSSFEFDGGGIDVRLYSGTQGNFSSGSIIGGENLVRAQPYSDETLRVQLNPGVSLDDFDSVSVWCVPIGISFGDAILAP